MSDDKEARAAKLAALNEELDALLRKYENTAVIMLVMGVQGEQVEGGGFRISERLMFANHSEAAHLFTPAVLATIARYQAGMPLRKGRFN